MADAMLPWVLGTNDEDADDCVRGASEYPSSGSVEKRSIFWAANIETGLVYAGADPLERM
jgi:hypothetical protein